MEKYSSKNIKEGLIALRALINKDAQAAVPSVFAMVAAVKNVDDIEAKAEAFHLAGLCFDISGLFDRALTWYSQALDLWLICQNKMGEAKTRNNIGMIYYEMSSFKDAIPFFKQSIDLKLELKEYKSVTGTYQNLGSAYEKLSEYKRAMEVYFKALKISEKAGDEGRMAELYQNIGNIYTSRNDNRQAIAFYQKARKVQEENDNKVKLMQLDNNVGIAFEQLKKYDEALQYYRQSLNVAYSINHIPVVLAAQNNIGRVLKLMSRFDEALSASQKGLQLSTTEADFYIQCNALTNIGEIHLLSKNYPEALTYLKKALQVCRAVGAKITETEIFLLLSKTYEGMQQAAPALKYYKQYDKVKTAIASTEIASRINQLQTQYEVGKKEEELIKTKALQAESELKALRAQMDPHFIFNSLSSLRKELLEGNIEKADTYIVRFSRLLRLILDTTRTPQVKLSDNIELLHLYIQIEQSRHPDSFSYAIKLAADIKPENIVVPGMVLQPLVENAIVHGLFNKQHGTGKLHIGFSKVGGSLKIKVSDNGVGRQKSNDTKVKGHLSHATSIIRETLALAWKGKMKDRFFDIKDKLNQKGEPDGTEVTVLLPYMHT